jgi:transcriptional regulator with XRE-family HTH domain
MPETIEEPKTTLPLREQTPKEKQLVKRLIRWRKENRLSQRQASDVMATAGITIKVSTIQAWEHGRPLGPMSVFGLTVFLDENPVVHDPPSYPHTDHNHKLHRDEMLAMRSEGMTQKEIGEKFGIGGSAVSRILSGKTNRSSRRS